jgi:thiamine-monophosphate kinase
MMPSENLKISDLGEKKLIKRLLKRSQEIPFKSYFFDEISFKSQSDDAALLNFGENYLVVTSDLLIRSAHFPEEMSFQQIGKKIVTVNISDLAAMGAEPLGITVAVALPRDLPVSDFDEMVKGILQACEQHHMPLIGGDTNESTELTLCGTCLGIVAKDKVMMKNGAKAEDVVAVTGPLGLAAAGFEILSADELKLKDLNPDFKNRVLKHALEPEAQLEEGLLLAKSGAITSATDITDGLLSEIGEIVDAGDKNIGITIYEELIPIPPEIYQVSKKIDKNPLEIALSYGEDFELLVTVREDKFEEIKDKFSLYKIGCVTASGQIHMVNKEGKTNIIVPKGYEHFKINKNNESNRD